MEADYKVYKQNPEVGDIYRGDFTKALFVILDIKNQYEIIVKYLEDSQVHESLIKAGDEEVLDMTNVIHFEYYGKQWPRPTTPTTMEKIYLSRLEIIDLE